MKYVSDVLGLEMRVWDYKIEMKGTPNHPEPIEVLTLLCNVNNGDEFEVETTSRVLINHIRGMDFSDGLGKRTKILTGVNKDGNEYYYFVRGL